VAPFAQIEGLRWRYSVGDWVLRDIRLDLKRGERVGLVGRSGSGKSSLALTFNGIIPQSYAGQMGGRVLVAGHVAATTLVADLARDVAMVFQSPDDQMSQILVRHEVASGPANLGLPLAEVHQQTAEALERLGIANLADRETTSLSGGEKQKVALAAALAMRPHLLVLDEPTTDLDPLAKSDLVATLQGLDPDMTLVIVSHDLETIAPLVDRLVVLDEGAIVADDSAARLLRQPAILSGHGIAAPQLAVLNAALRARHADWPDAAGAGQLVDNLAAQGLTPRPAPSPMPEPPPRSAPAVQLTNVTFAYPDAAAPAVENVSLSIDTGELVAIIGNNGSGKTTLSKLILGLLRPTHGSVRVLGAPVERIRPDSTGYIYQNPDAMLSQMSVREEVAFTPKLLGHSDWRADTENTLQRFGLERLETRFPLSLSKGQRQRLAYAAVTAAGPPILIFDEPTTGIDLPGCDQIMQYMDTLRRQQKTILFITHDMALAARWADRIVIMNNGRLVFAGPADSLGSLDPSRLADYHLKLPFVTDVARRLGLTGRVATPDDLLEQILWPVFACGG
jgi:energy-coupling factor transport system ATP-binding protein